MNKNEDYVNISKVKKLGNMMQNNEIIDNLNLKKLEKELTSTEEGSQIIKV